MTIIINTYTKPRVRLSIDFRFEDGLKEYLKIKELFETETNIQRSIANLICPIQPLSDSDLYFWRGVYRDV